MPHPLSNDLRERVVAFVEAGNSRNEAARHFDTSVSFAVNLMALLRETGSVEPRPVGGKRHGKLDPAEAFLLAFVARAPDVSMPELAAALLAEKGLKATPQSLSRWLIKKGCWLNSKAPFGHWGTQTFVAGLRCDGLIAPWVVDAPMNRAIFDTYVETQLVPTLRPGDVVIMDNLSSHKSQRAEKAIRARGAWLLFPPPYSPDLNPIEMAFSKLKAHLRSTAARTIDDLWKAIGNICALFTPDECSNYFANAGYASA